MFAKLRFQILLPMIGPILLIVVWELAIQSKWVKPILLPPPLDTIIYLKDSIFSGAVYGDFISTLKRTIYAFLLATVIGIPIGVAFGSNEKIYRSVEFLVDFFASNKLKSARPPSLLRHHN